MDTAIAVPAIIPGQRDDVGRQMPFVGIILDFYIPLPVRVKESE